MYTRTRAHTRTFRRVHYLYYCCWGYNIMGWKQRVILFDSRMYHNSDTFTVHARVLHLHVEPPRRLFVE